LLPPKTKIEYKKIIQDVFKRNQGIACKNCRYTLTEFRQSGKLKCAHCYDTFAVVLEPILLHFQGNIKHYGLSPAYHESNPIEEDLHISITKLEDELQNQVKIENYEAAAVLKNKIDKLKNKDS
jgi:protein arginine kinase activator